MSLMWEDESKSLQGSVFLKPQVRAGCNPSCFWSHAKYRNTPSPNTHHISLYYAAVKSHLHFMRHPTVRPVPANTQGPSRTSP